MDDAKKSINIGAPSLCKAPRRLLKVHQAKETRVGPQRVQTLAGIWNLAE